MILAIFFALVGAYCIFTGIRQLITGKAEQSLENKLKTFSQKGAKIYRQAYVVFCIVLGLAIVGFGVFKFLEELNIIPKSVWNNVFALAVVVVLIVIFAVVRRIAQKMTDD